MGVAALWKQTYCVSRSFNRALRFAISLDSTAGRCSAVQYQDCSTDNTVSWLTVGYVITSP
jgi:hypothetical protein